MIEAPANQGETVASIMFTRSEAMSYTSVSMTRPGKAWDGVEPGSDEWAAMQEKQQAVISEAGGTIVAGGWAVGFNAFINIITYSSKISIYNTNFIICFSWVCWCCFWIGLFSCRFYFRVCV